MADEDIYVRQQRWLDQLAVSPVVEVSGVVSPNGATGGRSRGEDFWTASLALEAWRIGTAELQIVPLRISRKVTDAELDHLRNTINPYAVVRIRARVGESAIGGYQALLEEFVGVCKSDADLNLYAERLQQPVTFENPDFGTFTIGRRVDWFAAEVVWDGKPVSLNLSDAAEVEASLKVAQILWQKQPEWNRRIRDFAVQELLPLKNESWLNEDEAELSPDEFKDRMTLESITVYPSGSFDFWHNDGDLFWGHSIQISGNLSDGPKHADIPG
jgi:hypothetical protein